MDDTQDAAPSSTEQQGIASAEVAQSGESSALGASSIGVVESATTESPMSTSTENLTTYTGEVMATTSGTEDPNAAIDAAAQPDTQPSAPAASTPSGILGTVESLPGEAVSYIRTHLADIKQHLGIKGFEQSAVQFIHDKIAAIEKWL